MTDETGSPLAAATWNPETERNVLASVLAGASPARLPITPADFYQPAHEHLYQLATDIAADGRTVDAAIVYDRLNPANRHHKLVLDLLPDLMHRGSSPNIESLADSLVESRRLRNLQILTVRIHQAIHDGQDADTITAAIAADLQQAERGSDTTQTLADVMPAVLDRIETGAMRGLSTPWPDLDRYIHGLRPGEMVIVAGRPAAGKSLFGQNMATHWVGHHGKHVMLASLEMDATQIGSRIVADLATVEQDAMMAPGGMRDEANWARITQHMERLTDTRLHISDRPGQTLAQIARQAHAIHNRNPLGLLVIDYLQLVRPRDLRVNREQQISEISRGIKILAKELHVPVVALSQFSRAGAKDGNRPPQLTDLRESGSLEQDADIVIGLYHPELDAKSVAKGIVLKARQGREGELDLFMQTKFARISTPSRGWQS